jgi:hypothetical protein
MGSQHVWSLTYKFYKIVFSILLCSFQSESQMKLWVFIILILSGVRLSPLGTAVTTGLLYQHQRIDYDDCGAIGGMKIGSGNLSIRRKPAPVPLCPPQIPHDLTRARTRTAAMGIRWVTAWAMVWPIYIIHHVIKVFYSLYRTCRKKKH